MEGSAALLQRFEEKLREAARVLDGLAMYAPASAQEAVREVAQELERAFAAAASRLAARVAATLQEREDAQEDWDSPANVYLLQTLQHRAVALGR